MEREGFVKDGKVVPKRMAPTEAARAVYQSAKAEARRLNHDFVGAEHLLLGLVELKENAVSKVLIEVGVTVELVRAELEKLRCDACGLMTNLPLTPRARGILERAEANARKLGSPRVSEAHVLMALLQETDGLPARWFRGFAIRVDVLKERVFAEIVKIH